MMLVLHEFASFSHAVVVAFEEAVIASKSLRCMAEKEKKYLFWQNA